MNIVVLDGFTLNPGDLTWDGFNAFGDVQVYDRSTAKESHQRAKDAEILLINKINMSSEVIDSLPAMRYIGVLATGFNVVDLEAARAKDIPVTNIPTYGTQSVAQAVFAHLLDFTNKVAHHDQTVREAKKWTECPDFCYWDHPLVELEGLTLGLVGLGRIGRATASIAQAFGMNVVAHDIVQTNPPEGVTFVDLDQVFEQSDVVSLHCPLTADNENLINAERLSQMKSSAFLINTSRGPLVDASALASALNNGDIAGASLDVLAQEPPAADHPLFTAKNCRITPHIAWATRSARSRLMQTAVDNVKAFLDGNPQNVVN